MTLNARQQVEERVLARRAAAVAGGDDLDRLAQRLGRLLLRMARAQPSPLGELATARSRATAAPASTCVPRSARRWRRRRLRTIARAAARSGTWRTTRAGTPMTSARAGTSFGDDRAGGDERLLADLDARHEHRAAADPARAAQRRARAAARRGRWRRHRVVVGRHRARADEDVVLDRRMKAVR